MKKIKISIVSYTNTLPFKWALQRSTLLKNIDLRENMPSVCAEKLKQGLVDMALVPVAVLAEIPTYFIESDYCIGANGKVDSVKLYSQVPLHEIKNVTLDYQSRSSIALTRVLFKFFWKKEVNFVDGQPGFEKNINGNNAGVVIGDRTFNLNGSFNYEYDLAETWKEFTGLPFVFAAWVSTKQLPAEFIESFNAVLKYGAEHIHEAVAADYRANDLSPDKVLAYLTARIDYKFDAPKREALQRFLQYLNLLDNDFQR